MGKDYRYISENTLQYVYLHDCGCRHMHCIDHRLIFEMEWMEILREHPLNPFPHAHQSEEGRIELFDPKIVECTLAVYGSGEICGVDDVRDLDYCGLEFLKYEETYGVEKPGVYRADMYMIFDKASHFRDISMSIEYRKSLVMWDDLKEVSWFEDLDGK